MYANEVVAEELAQTFYGSTTWSKMSTNERQKSIERFVVETKQLQEIVFNTILRLRQSIDSQTQ